MTARGPILVPTDFSAAAAIALGHARLLARPVGAEIVLVHVEEGPWSDPPGRPSAGVRREVARAIAGEVERLRAAALRCRGLLARGEPVAEILRAAARERAGLIVLGSHGQGGKSGLLLGHVADRVVRRAAVPVLVTRAGPAPR